MAIYRGDGGAGDADNDVTVTTVTQKALEADNSATEAAASAVQSANSASAASTSASNAATSETNAANSATSASTSATNAATSATSASTSASNAASSASAASTSETNAASSASAASTSASNAATSETNAATSESNAASSASAASTSASNAATSASAASTSATNAATSATNAATSASNAATSATNAAASYDSFDDRYLGAKASDPTLDNDGDALITGALYFNTTDDVMKVYDGTSWLTAYVSLSGALIATNNLSDLTNAATARTNLGLGTAATTASTDYATAAQGTLADSAVQPADNVSTLTNDAGYLTGNQTITLSGDATGSGTTAITVTVADDSHNHIISNVDGLQTALDAKGTLSNVVEDLTPQLGGNLDTNNNDINFGDNDKAVFGAGSDLQIYHTGTASVIREQGVGSLYIDGSSEIFLRGQSGFTNMIKAIDGAEVELYHNNNLKLETTSTGVDVTGTVTADGLTVDTDTLHVDATNNRVGIGTVTPSTALDVSGTVTATAFSGDGSGLTGVGGGDVVDDITPQLGGNLDLNSNDITGTGNLLPSGNIELLASTTESRYIEMGKGRTDNGYAYIDLVGDATYTDYGCRLIRGNAGANTNSEIIHRGTGFLNLTATDAGAIAFKTSNTERARISSTGDFSFNSGYGSVGIAYGVRAWVNFRGTSTVTIRASGNVSSVTDFGTGQYRANFTNAMPDANYGYTVMAGDAGTNRISFDAPYINLITTTDFRFRLYDSGNSEEDCDYVSFTAIR